MLLTFIIADEEAQTTIDGGIRYFCINSCEIFFARAVKSGFATILQLETVQKF